MDKREPDLDYYVPRVQSQPTMPVEHYRILATLEGLYWEALQVIEPDRERRALLPPTIWVAVRRILEELDGRQRTS